jgi:hypothetical protein
MKFNRSFPIFSRFIRDLPGGDDQRVEGTGGVVAMAGMGNIFMCTSR